MPRSPDGRLARGADRKQAIIAATLAVIEEDGVAGVTHRAVANRIGGQPSLVVYHFATLDDLLVAALTAAVQEYDAQYAALRADGLDGLAAMARLIVDAAGAGRQRAIAEWELTLLAARRPALRPAAGLWRDLVTRVAQEHTDDPDAVATLVALSDGLCARLLVADAGESMPVEEVEALLRRVIRRRR